MNRRDFLKSAGAAGVATTSAALGAAVPQQPRQVVVILGESVRKDMLNCYRNTGLKTPNLDRLASEGIRFNRAYNCQPVCAPARSAIWTGLYPHTNGVWGNSMPLGDTTHTIGQRLADRGIDCALIGKWHLSGTDYFDTGRPAPGWNGAYWYDMRRYLSELSPTDRQRSRKMATGDDPSWTAEMCYGRRVTDRAIDYLAERKGQDFFLAVAHDEPHDPSLCPIEYTAMYRDFQFPVDPNVRDTLKGKPAEQNLWAESLASLPADPARRSETLGRRHFFGSHTFIDAEIGRLLEQIERCAPNALVIYTSDHGVFLQSHQLEDKGPAMYEEITNVPFLVRWPGKAPVNTTSEALVSHIDLSGTIMDFFGFEVPKTLEGTSMLPLFLDPQGKDPKTPVRKEVFLEWGRYEVDHDGFGGVQPIRCVCDGRYKLSVHLMTSDELYDLHQDPGELHNLIDSPEHAAIRDGLHDRLLAWMNASRDPFRGYYWGRRPWRAAFPETWANAGMTRQRENDGYLPRELDYATGLTMVHATRPK